MSEKKTIDLGINIAENKDLDFNSHIQSGVWKDLIPHS
jgi:hypothetical protein